MRGAWIAVFLLAVTAFAENIKLYLKDGSYQIVREYHVETDRVRFYSVERSEWEEVPLTLVDMRRTQGEAAARQAEINADSKAMAEEEKAERDLKAEISRIPQDPGVYYMIHNQVKAIKAAESKVHNDKGRSVLKILSPIPIVSGKATLELDGMHSANLLTNPEQEFYIQLSAEERFGIVKLTPFRGVRIVEKMSIVPVTKEVIEEPIIVQVFTKQLTQDGLYKLWPMKPLDPGEYAVVEYTPGKVNMQVWDFAMETGGPSAARSN